MLVYRLVCRIDNAQTNHDPMTRMIRFNYEKIASGWPGTHIATSNILRHCIITVSLMCVAVQMSQTLGQINHESSVVIWSLCYFIASMLFFKFIVGNMDRQKYLLELVGGNCFGTQYDDSFLSPCSLFWYGYPCVTCSPHGWKRMGLLLGCLKKISIFITSQSSWGNKLV